MMLFWIYLNFIILRAASSDAQSVGQSILFTKYTSDAKRSAEIFSGVLSRPEYKDLKVFKISPIFLEALTVPATAIELENQYRIIKNSSIYVQIGPENFYGPSFFPKQTQTNDPKVTRRNIIGFDLSLAIQNSVIGVAIDHLINNLGVIKLAYIFDVIDEEILGFLKGAVGRFRVYHVKDFKDTAELLSAVLVDDANVFVVNAKQESTLKILQTGVTLAENNFNVRNANFFAIEISPNGNLTDYTEFASVPKPITSRDLIFRDTVVFALKVLAGQLNKQVDDVPYITTTIEEVNQETIKQTWNFYSYIDTQYNLESLYKVTVLGNGSVSASIQNLKSPPSTQEVLSMMRSRTLRLATINVPPLTTTVVDANGKKELKGPEIAVAKELMKRLNLSYKITVFDSPVGEKTDDVWTGLFRNIEQWDLDMLVGPFTLTLNRSIDFQASTPVRSISYNFIYRNPSLSSYEEIFQFVVAFDVVTWVLIFVTAVVVGGSLAVLHKINPGNTSYTLHLSMLFVFGYLLQGVRTRLPTFASSQLLIVVWWFFSLILVIAFCTNYAAYRSFTAFENLPNSIVSLIHQSYYKYSYIKGSSMEYLMSVPLDSEIYSLYQIINTKFKDVIPSSREEGIDEVLKGRFALLDESTINAYNAKKYCLKSGLPLWFGAYVFYMPKQLSYGAIFDEEINAMRSDGTLDNIYKTEESLMMSTLPTYCGATFQDQVLEVMRNPLINWSDYSVEFVAAVGIFIVSIIGLLIVFIILLVEYLLGIYEKDTNQ